MIRKMLIAVILMAGSVLAGNLSVTVYNSDLGVISETRSLEFNKGQGRISFVDVPSRIDANSVRFELSGAGGNVSILEQNYAYDLVSPEKMYLKYIDKGIEIFDKDGKLYSGTLLSAGQKQITLMDKSGGIKIIQLSNVAEVNFPSLPDGLITRPTLFWLYNSDISGARDCNVSYQTSGLSWSAEYVGLLSEDEKMLDLSGWAAIRNNSGKTYDEASLKLVAGEINRANQFRGGRTMELSMVAKSAPMSDGFAEKEFFEYHLYTLPRKATLANHEIKQISLFDPAMTPVKKTFIYKPDQNPTKVEVDLKFKNSMKSGLGMPLPAGRIRLFQADSDGSLIMLGEDRIDHTPKDEELDIMVGYAFDIGAEHRIMNETRPSKQIMEQTFEIELRNHKSENIEIIVEKNLYGPWEILDTNYDFKKKNATKIEFAVPVAADSDVILKFTVRFTYR